MILLAILLASLLAPYEKSAAPPLPSDSQAAFDEVFEYVRTIDLPDDAPEAITSIDVDDAERLLLLESMSDVVIIDPATGSQTSLGENTCTDVVAWVPRAARFAPGGSIIVVSGAAAYAFTADGTCSHRLHDAFSPPGSFDVTRQGNLVAYHYLPPPARLTVHNPSGEMLYSTTIDVERPALNGRISSGSIAAGDGWVFVSRPLNPRLVRGALDASTISYIGWRPQTYRIYIGHDLPPGAFSQETFNRAHYTSRHSISVSVLYVGDGIVLQQHANQYRPSGSPDRYSINLMDLEGQSLTYVQLLASRPFIAARDGYLFRWAPRSDAARRKAIDVYRLSRNTTEGSR